MEIRGTIETFEGRRACAPLSKHVLGWRRHFQWYVVAGMIVSGLIGNALLELVAPTWGFVASLAAAVIGIVILLRVAPSMAQSA
jgi:membrane protein YdbS with pleckstrin-like domain